MPNQPKGIEELKKWFEANYLDGDSVQKGQMLSSEVCLEALTAAYTLGRQHEIEELSALVIDTLPILRSNQLAHGVFNCDVADRPINNERE